MLHIHCFVFNEFLENTYVVWDETGECIIVDAGCHSPAERDDLVKFIEGKKLKPVLLLNTHAHIDHIFGIKWAKEKFNVPFALHELEIPMLQSTASVASFYGMQVEPPPDPDVLIEEGKNICFGKTSLEILLTPGHSVGSVSFYHSKENILLSGDVLFQNSIGRTDLPGGDYETLMESIFQKLLPLPASAKVYSGHGPVTTIGEEKRNNPFVLEYEEMKRV